jgi:hypothetical protein
MLYNVVLFFEAEKGERVCYADLTAHYQRKYFFFGKVTYTLSLELDNLYPSPMCKEDAELTSKLAWLTFRKHKLKRVEIQEALSPAYS